MSTAARALLRTLRRQGVVLVARGDRLRVDAPAGIATPETREALAATKPDVLATLAAEDRVVEMSLREFEDCGYGIEVAVPWMQETLWLIPSEEHAAALEQQGIGRGRIWTADEIAILHSFGLTEEEVRNLAMLKSQFNAALDIEEEPSRDLPCRCCHGTLFWMSRAGARVCAECHPPAAPHLVQKWIEAGRLGRRSLTDQGGQERLERVKQIVATIDSSTQVGECPHWSFAQANKEEERMRLSSLFPSKYMKADELNGNVECRIRGLGLEELNGEKKPVLQFVGMEKGLVLNKTNASVIESAYGDETDDWIGKTVVVYSDKTQFQGKLVPCVRVRIPAPVRGDEVPL